jgi:hypothetical protein
MSELTKQFDSLSVVGTSRSCLGSESTYVNKCVLKSDSGSPRPYASDFCTKCYAFVLASLLILLVILAVGQILAHGAWAQIFIAIVQAIAITVIYVRAVPSYYFSMHPGCGFGVLVDRIPSLTASIEVCLPSSIRQAVVSVSGNNCVLAKCEPNISARFVIDVYDFFRNFCMLGVPIAVLAESASLGFYRSAFRAIIVLVGTLLGWCKIVSWLGASFTRSHHDLSAIEVVWSGHTLFIVPELEATYALL